MDRGNLHGVMCYCRGYSLPKEGLHWVFLGTPGVMDARGGMFMHCRITRYIHASFGKLYCKYTLPYILN